MMDILVIGTDDAIRTQIAAGYLAYYAQERLRVETAGISPALPEPEVVRAMESDFIDVSQNLPRAVTDYAGQHFDYVLTVAEVLPADYLSGITYNHLVHFSFPVWQTGGSPEQLSRLQEAIKREVLLFLGSLP